MDVFTIIGLTAAALTTFSSLPQLFKIIRTHKTRDISLIMFVMMATGVALWIVYGVSQRDLPLILANSVSICFLITIIVYKIIYK